MIDVNSLLNHFTYKLNRKLREKVASDRDLALFCRTSEANILFYKNGDRLPNPWYLVLIAEYFECTVNEMLGLGSSHSMKRSYNKASETFSSRYPFEVYLSNNIKSRMNETGIDVITLSNYSGVHVNTIRIWTGNHPRLPRITQFIQLCGALDCTPTDLLGY